MSEWKLHKLPNLCHLFPASTNIIVSNLIQISLLILSLNRLTLAVDDGILCHDAILRWVNLHHLEFYLSHTTTHRKEVTLSDGTVSFAKVGGEENIEQRAGQAFNRISDR